MEQVNVHITLFPPTSNHRDSSEIPSMSASRLAPGTRVVPQMWSEEGPGSATHSSWLGGRRDDRQPSPLSGWLVEISRRNFRLASAGMAVKSTSSW